MSDASPNHECDLFLLSSHHRYFASRGLAQFAQRGSLNVDGWGIGSYLDGSSHVLRSAEAAVEGGSRQLGREFAIAIEAVSSPVILGHLRRASRGAVRVENNHPFGLTFLGYDWLLVHNGTAREVDLLASRCERLLTTSTCDSARVFEYLRARIVDYAESSPKRSLIAGCRAAFGALLRDDPEGSFNLILSNGYLTFVLVHWRPFYLLRREKVEGDATLVSTLPLTTLPLTDEGGWLEFDPQQRARPKLLVFSGPTLVLNADLPRRAA